MMTSSNGNIFLVTGHLCGEFTGPRWIPHTKASDAELWKQWWGWWFETLSRPLWRHRNEGGVTEPISSVPLIPSFSVSPLFTYQYHIRIW